MKIRALATVALIVAGMIGPCFAVENSTKGDLSAAYALLAGVDGGLRADRLVQKATCDPDGDGKQANCMRECQEEEIRARDTYATANADPKVAAEERKVAKLACDKKCGC